MEIGLLVLAAGQSSRMTGTHKLLRPWPSQHGGTTVIEHVFETLILAHTWSSVRCVLPPIPRALSHLIEPIIGVENCVLNPHPEEGKGSSIALGVASFPSGLDGVVICLADLPLLTKEIVRIIVQKAKLQRIVMPVTSEGPRHPIFFASDYLESFKSLRYDQGGKRIIEEHSNDIIKIRFDDSTPFEDIDNEASYRRALGIAHASII